MKLAEIENEKEFQVSQKASRKSYSLKVFIDLWNLASLKIKYFPVQVGMSGLFQREWQRRILARLPRQGGDEDISPVAQGRRKTAQVRSGQSWSRRVSTKQIIQVCPCIFKDTLLRIISSAFYIWLNFRYRVIFPELHDWASSKRNVSRKELKTQGSILMVRSKLAPKERTPLGHLSFNDMILAKFLKEYGNEFVKKPSYLPSANENSKFVCEICNYRQLAQIFSKTFTKYY